MPCGLQRKTQSSTLNNRIEKGFFQYSKFLAKAISIISVQLVAESDEKSFDSFIIQVVGRLDDSGNFTFFGQWKSIPQIGELIDCGKYRGAAIVDKGFSSIKQNIVELAEILKF